MLNLNTGFKQYNQSSVLNFSQVEGDIVHLGKCIFVDFAMVYSPGAINRFKKEKEEIKLGEIRCINDNDDFFSLDVVNRRVLESNFIDAITIDELVSAGMVKELEQIWTEQNMISENFVFYYENNKNNGFIAWNGNLLRNKIILRVPKSNNTIEEYSIAFLKYENEKADVYVKQTTVMKNTPITEGIQRVNIAQDSKRTYVVFKKLLTAVYIDINLLTGQDTVLTKDLFFEVAINRA